MEIREKLNDYASYNCNTWIADLKHEYFNSPWTSISLFAAILLLVLNILQTAHDMSDFYRH